MALRDKELSGSTKPFVTRGSRVIRCESCLLPKPHCICDQKPDAVGTCAVVLLMAQGEYYKPSNTGRLIADVVPENYAYKWCRTQAQPELLRLLADTSYQPYLIFPHEYAPMERCVNQVKPSTRKPLFIFLDGTWREAKRMFRKSDYLQCLPVLSISTAEQNDYVLREAAHDYQLCTAQVAVKIFQLAGEQESALALDNYFKVFTSHYLKGKPDRKHRA
ncbi:DTW domain-containing protein [Salinimonas sp. HHU 13199]|uniref:tRNA-uridine aminocarboxypropyltransferase n=1 Tax=Salinimonas profundi TaxID=2729140 RepID=A0ABR8LCX5_9ALTE|nr:DTW domain-containing protein [Salinimonas profundi]MBD3584161.1 DTW domain-containing protein [Salinimonas profundi]